MEETKKVRANDWIEFFFEKIQRNLSFVFFLVMLGLIYIWNTHYALLLVKKINVEAKELKELRWEYLTIKSDLMYKSKLTEVLPRAKAMGLNELDKPPYKITLKSKDYQRQN